MLPRAYTIQKTCPIFFYFQTLKIQFFHSTSWDLWRFKYSHEKCSESKLSNRKKNSSIYFPSVNHFGWTNKYFDFFFSFFLDLKKIIVLDGLFLLKNKNNITIILSPFLKEEIFIFQFFLSFCCKIYLSKFYWPINRISCQLRVIFFFLLFVYLFSNVLRRLGKMPNEESFYFEKSVRGLKKIHIRRSTTSGN